MLAEAATDAGAMWGSEIVAAIIGGLFTLIAVYFGAKRAVDQGRVELQEQFAKQRELLTEQFEHERAQAEAQREHERKVKREQEREWALTYLRNVIRDLVNTVEQGKETCRNWASWVLFGDKELSYNLNARRQHSDAMHQMSTRFRHAVVDAAAYLPDDLIIDNIERLMGHFEKVAEVVRAGSERPHGYAEDPDFSREDDWRISMTSLLFVPLLAVLSDIEEALHTLITKPNGSLPEVDYRVLEPFESRTHI